MKIAIIGAGFAGLALAYWLTRSQQNEVILFDRSPIGQSTSGLAAGLLHPYRSSSFQETWNANDCMRETLFLLKQASTALSYPCYSETGILRPLTVDKDLDVSFTEDIEFWPKEKTMQLNGINPIDACFLKRGITVDCPRYLEGLFTLCTKSGMQFRQEQISSIEDIPGFDKIAICAGAYVTTIAETKTLPIVPIKGQLLELAHASNETLPFPLFAKAYMITKEARAIVGSTFERRFTHVGPDPLFAEADLRKKIHAFSSYYASLPLICCKSGLRATTKDHRPLIQRTGNNCFCLTGLGSRGLLYHAFIAKQLAHLLLT